MAKTFTTKLQKFKVSYYTKDEFHHLKREIFTNDSYYFESDNPEPVIIDAGAHIGLATLYFKKQYPGAKITAIEPNPLTFHLLEENIFENQLDDVKAINAALDNETANKDFYLDDTPNEWWSTAGFIPGAWTGDQDTRAITVPTVTLSELIHEPVDFLKMDIEGAEQAVMQAAKHILPLIKHFIIEFHPHPGQDQFKFVEMLEQHFNLQFFKDGKQTTLKRARGLFQIEGKIRANSTN